MSDPTRAWLVREKLGTVLVQSWFTDEREAVDYFVAKAGQDGLEAAALIAVEETVIAARGPLRLVADPLAFNVPAMAPMSEPEVRLREAQIEIARLREELAENRS